MRLNGRQILLVGSAGQDLWESAIMLTRFGHEVHIAESGKIGFQKIHENDFDLICVKSKLPDLKGLDFIASLAHEQQLKVIFCLEKGEYLEGPGEEFAVHEVLPEFPKIPDLAVIVCDFFISSGEKQEFFNQS